MIYKTQTCVFWFSFFQHEFDFFVYTGWASKTGPIGKVSKTDMKQETKRKQMVEWKIADFSIKCVDVIFLLWLQNAVTWSKKNNKLSETLISARNSALLTSRQLSGDQD